MSRPKDFSKLSKSELIDEAKRLSFTVSRRGHSIGALYAVIQTLVQNSPYAVPVNSPASDETMVQYLQQQLSDARKALVDLKRNENSKAEGISISEEEVEKEAKRKDSLLKSDCVICFESFTDAKKPVCISCGHIFCEPCILKHQENKLVATCPLCRTSFSSFIPLFI